MAFAILLLAASACAARSTSPRAGLEGRTWRLTTIDGQPPLDGTRPTLELDGGQLAGDTGCNLFGGGYQVRGEQLTVQDLFSTERGCVQPEGVMEQEATYLARLRDAHRFDLAGDTLTISAGPDEILTFSIQPAAVQQTPTGVPVTPTPPVVEPPAGFKEYRDAAAGIAIYIPDSWRVTGVIEGEYAILQSYPEDKYVGGGRRDPADTKCDLNLRPSDETIEDIVQRWAASPQTTILAQQDVAMGSGRSASRFELDSMGRANVLLVALDARVVQLTCFGNFEPFDAVASTLHEVE